MADGLHTEELEKDDFERGFDAAESGDDLIAESLNEDAAEESDDSALETGGGEGDPLSGDEDADLGDVSASDQILPEDDESGEESDSSDTDGADLHGSEDGSSDSFAEGRDILDQYFGPSSKSINQPEAGASKQIEMPEDIKAEADAILRVNPDYRDILLEDSEQGQRYRTNLVEFGPEATVGMLESAHQLRLVNPRVDAVISKHEDAQRTAHFDAIGQDHPDYINLVNDPGKVEKLKEFNSSVTSWIEDQPYKDAQKAFRVMESGSAAQVSELLTQYKEATSGPKRDVVDREAARKITGVPGKRKAVSGRTKPDPNDFDGGFEAAAAEE